MNQTKAVATIGGIGAALGGLDWLWSLLASFLPLPPEFATMPCWARIIAVVVAVGGLVLSTIKTSNANPDGTPATQEYDPAKLS